MKQRWTSFFFPAVKRCKTIYDNLESVEEAYLKIPDVGEEEAEEGESQRPLRHCADDMSCVTLKKRSHRRARLKKVPYTCFLKAGVAWPSLRESSAVCELRPHPPGCCTWWLKIRTLRRGQGFTAVCWNHEYHHWKAICVLLLQENAAIRGSYRTACLNLIAHFTPRPSVPGVITLPIW